VYNVKWLSVTWCMSIERSRKTLGLTSGAQEPGGGPGGGAHMGNLFLRQLVMALHMSLYGVSWIRMLWNMERDMCRILPGDSMVD